MPSKAKKRAMPWNRRDRIETVQENQTISADPAVKEIQKDFIRGLWYRQVPSASIPDLVPPGPVVVLRGDKLLNEKGPPPAVVLFVGPEAIDQQIISINAEN